ncbi:MAG: protein TolQ [Mariprofundaceae bacterium]|nr:protein TolQ [Mariprofundaceae bacterium]
MNEAAHNLSIWVLVLDAGIVVQLVLIILLLLSFVSWAIIFHKWRTFRAVKADDVLFNDLFWDGSDMEQVLKKSQDLAHSPQAHVFEQGFREYLRLKQDAQQQPNEAAPTAASSMLSVRHAVDKAWSAQMDQHGAYLSFLATVGSTAPFIGLFGTVWGIIDAFQNIGLTQNTSLATVAPGIAEALVATAFGLLAAIPAVIAYNAFSGKMKAMNQNLDAFATEFIHVLSRYMRK